MIIGLCLPPPPDCNLHEDRICFSFVPPYVSTAQCSSWHTIEGQKIFIKEVTACILLSRRLPPSVTQLWPVSKVHQWWVLSLLQFSRWHPSLFSFSFPLHVLMVFPQEGLLEPLGMGLGEVSVMEKSLSRGFWFTTHLEASGQEDPALNLRITTWGLERQSYKVFFPGVSLYPFLPLSLPSSFRLL